MSRVLHQEIHYFHTSNIVLNGPQERILTFISYGNMHIAFFMTWYNLRIGHHFFDILMCTYSRVLTRSQESNLGATYI